MATLFLTHLRWGDMRRRSFSPHEAAQRSRESKAGQTVKDEDTELRARRTQPGLYHGRRAEPAFLHTRSPDSRGSGTCWRPL